MPQHIRLVLRVKRAGVCAVLALALIATFPNPTLAAGTHPPKQGPVTATHELIIPGLEEPLVPMAATSQQEDTDVLAAAQAFRNLGKAGQVFPNIYQPFVAYMGAHPNSGWNVAILTNMGLASYHAGYFTEAMTAYQQAWETGKSATDIAAMRLVDRAVGELAKMHARLGHAAQLQSLFTEIGNRPIAGSASEKVTGAHEGVWIMQNQPGIAFMCGPKALENLLLSMGQTMKQVSFIETYQSSATGVTLAQVAQLADQAGLAYRLIQRSPGQAIPVPSVIHWKLNHYAAIVGTSDGLYHIKDPTFGGDLMISGAAIDQEASGYFLVPESLPVDPGWQALSASESAQIYGKGFVSAIQAGTTNTASPAMNSAPPANTAPAAMGPTCSGIGMCNYDAQLLTISLALHDTPVGYAPQLGPPVYVGLTYNQREDSQPATFSFFNVSQEWTLNVLSYVVDDPNTVGSNVMLYLMGGGADYYPEITGSYNGVTGAFPPDIQTQAVLSRTPALGVATSYQLTYPDGSEEIFAASNGSTGYPRLLFLSQLIDKAGNALTFNYDDTLRLTSITDATARSTTFSYGIAGSPLLVTKITDPFGRSATLTYNSNGQLASSTDVLGITSSYAYDVNDLVDAMTTPYGTSSFSYDLNPSAPDGRYLNMTDPLGYTERIEFNEEAPGIPVDTAATVPSGYGLNFTYAYMSFRNTFHWDKYVYATYGISNYANATLTHWLHNSAEAASPVIESTKKPLENRVWRAYPDQYLSYFEGTSIDTPTAIARVLDDGSTQASLASYNAIGKPTQIIDPVGRATNFIYAANSVDLLTVQQQTSPSASTTIASATYNLQHEPLTVTDAAGQTTSYSYNSAGQVLSATNALGQTTSYAYDALGRLTTITNANAVTQASYTYDAFDRVATATDSEGYVESYGYDAMDRVTSITYPDATTDTYTYTNLDLTSHKDRLGRVTGYAFDADRRMTAMTDPLGGVTKYAYFQNGTLQSITDPDGNVTSWTIDLQSRPATKTYADGHTESYSYETTTSRLHAVTDALAQVKSLAYTQDNMVRAIAYTGSVNPTPNVAFAYDPYFPRKTTMTDGNGTTSYAYVPIGTLGALQLASETSPFTNGSVAYTFDALGRAATRTIDSTADSFGYDPLGRLTQHTTPLGSFAYAYLGQTGQITSRMLSASIASSYAYDTNANDRRLLSITNTGASRSYAFTSNPYQIASIGETPGTAATLPSRSWAYGYDSLDRLLTADVTTTTTTTGGGTGMCPHHHRHHDLDDYRRFGHGEFCDDLRDRDRRRTDDLERRIEQQHPGMFVHDSDRDQDWDDRDGDRDRDHDRYGDHDHDHDRDKTCTTGSGSGSGGGGTTTSTADYTYVYDATGNITSFDTPADTAPVAATYNDLNELTAYATQPYSYDLDGNLTSDGIRTYSWDAENRLVGVSVPGSPPTTIAISYDGLGRRTAITETGATTTVAHYFWCGDTLCQARSGTDVVTRHYYAEGESHLDTAVNLVYMQDQLGSVRDTLNASTGILVDSLDYDAYGDLTTTASLSAYAPDMRYASMFYNSGSGLSLTEYRPYDPSISRWVTRDPAREEAGINLYAYVGGNPVSYIDPHGQWSLLGAGIGTLVGAGYGALGAILANGDIFAIGGSVIAGGVGGGVTGFFTPTNFATLSAIAGASDLSGQYIAYKMQDIAQKLCTPFAANYGSIAGSVFGAATLGLSTPAVEALLSGLGFNARQIAWFAAARTSISSLFPPTAGSYIWNITQPTIPANMTPIPAPQNMTPIPQ